MEEAGRRIGPRAVFAIVALVLVAMVLWAASALAAGGSGSNAPDSSDSPAVANVQSESDGARTHDDCPNRDRAFEQSSDV